MSPAHRLSLLAALALAACSSPAATTSPDPMTSPDPTNPPAPTPTSTSPDGGVTPPPPPPADPCAGRAGLAIDRALSLNTTQLHAGDTLSGTVVYKNCSSAPIMVKDVVVTSRPPGGTHATGPYDDFAPSKGATTIAAGASLTLSATRTIAGADPSGAWIAYATYEDASGTWHDGPDVAFAVQASSTVQGSNPTDPIDDYTADQTFTLNSGTTDYYVSVPASYDRTHKTPMTLFVWLHGCGGEGYWDASMVSPGQRGEPQDWISIALGGREKGCWDPMNDVPWVLAAIASVETHFDVNTKRVILGGYSSGGDLGYPTAFMHSELFAGILVENSDPFDNGYDASTLLAAAKNKLHVVHLAHLRDGTYPIDTVRGEIGQVESAGFPTMLIERDGTHWDDPAPNLPGTAADLQTVLLPYIDSGWSSP